MRAVIAIAALASACGGGAGTYVTNEQNWTIPDSWTCATQVWESGGVRSIGNDAFTLVPGGQGAGEMRIYHPVDAAHDAIVLVKSSSYWYDWTATMTVRAVIASAGPGKTTIFDYRPGVTSGRGLATNDNVQGLEATSLVFCFDSPPPVCP